MKQEGSIHIIGGGVIGLCSAYYLERAGYNVTVIDANNIQDGTSFGNAGLIVPSHFIPLAAPGVISKGMRWMFNPKSPFYIRPRMSLDLLKWLWHFYKSCTQQHVDETKAFLRDYNLLSKKCYAEMAEELGLSKVDYRTNGLLVLCRSQKVFEEEVKTAEIGEGLGLDVEIVNPQGIEELNNGLSTDAIGGVYYRDDASIHSNRFMQALLQKLQASGVQFVFNTKIQDIKMHGAVINGLVTSDNEIIQVEKVVLAGGVWSTKLLKKMGVPMLMQDGKGYSITLKNPINKPTIPTILSEAKVAITPMHDDLRITGTLEISNLSASINRKRVQGFLEAVPRYYPDLSPDIRPAIENIWTGFRPCTPDGLPYMEKSIGAQNLVVATGHAMMGMSLGPASGYLVSQITNNEIPSIPVDKMKINRF